MMNVYSQYGEDGIIEKIISKLPRSEKWCVEFGAWDGFHLSNTRNLIENHGYSAVLIEGDKERFKLLQSAYKGSEEVATLNRYVGYSEHNSLDSILRETPIPHNFDLLSIDIDGNDYHVWEAFTEYQPRIVIIEFNPTFPFDIEFVQPRNMKVNQGSSIKALQRLAATKDYLLAAATTVNAIFVHKEFYSLLNIESDSITNFGLDSTYQTSLSVGYDGTIFLFGSKKLPWHGVELAEQELQCLPFFIREYRGDYGLLRRALFKLYRVYRNLRYGK